MNEVSEEVGGVCKCPSCLLVTFLATIARVRKNKTSFWHRLKGRMNNKHSKRSRRSYQRQQQQNPHAQHQFVQQQFAQYQFIQQQHAQYQHALYNFHQSEYTQAVIPPSLSLGIPQPQIEVADDKRDDGANWREQHSEQAPCSSSGFVQDWSRDSPPPPLPSALRRRISTIFMRDTTMLQNLMAPQNNVSLSHPFCNFGKISYDPSTKLGALQKTRVTLRVQVDQAPLASYWLTGITSTCRSGRKIFVHKALDSSILGGHPLLLTASTGGEATVDVDIELFGHETMQGLSYDWLLFELCRVDCTKTSVCYNHFVMGSLMVVKFDNSLTAKNADMSPAKTNADRGVQMNARAMAYVPLQLRRTFSLEAIRFDEKDNTHIPLHVRHTSLKHVLNVNLKNIYSQHAKSNRKMLPELLWPNRTMTSKALDPEAQCYSLHAELLLAGPLASKFGRQKKNVLTQHHYLSHWMILLNIEETRLMADIQELDMHNVSFRRNKGLSTSVVRVAIDIPGSDEQRPYLTYGMKIKCRIVNVDNFAKEIVGYVSDRQGTTVNVDFCAESMRMAVTAKDRPGRQKSNIPEIENETFHLRFVHQKHYYMAMRTGILLMDGDAKTMFPTKTSLDTRCCQIDSLIDHFLKSLNESRWIDQTINTEQKRAVATILSRCCGLAPYIIHGPPGTGKTKTVVEAANQIIRQNFCFVQVDGKVQEQPLQMDANPVRILICAPSDIACDILCKRLSATLKPSEMFRMNLPQRKVNEVVELEVLPYCAVSSEGDFELHPCERVQSFKVVICTCAAASLLLSFKASNGTFALQEHFQNIFIDEAGQALEPETLIPIAIGRVGNGRATIVMSGDHLQLQPAVRSPVALCFGFGTSMQERLLGLPLYQEKNTLSRFVFIRLLSNYRSHRQILAFSSSYFYGNSLRAMCEQEKANAFLTWEDMPVNRAGEPFPCIVYRVDGSELLDIGSTSFYNNEEADKVVAVIQRLLSSKTMECRPHMIAVMAAYWQQVRLIRKKLRKVELGSIRVGVVDDYQGQEAPITILSCVLSETQKHLNEMVSPLSGLLGSPKRANVALTRAMGLSIVIASSTFLRNDSCFGKLAKYCAENNALVGASEGLDCAGSPKVGIVAEDREEMHAPPKTQLQGDDLVVPYDEEDSKTLPLFNFMEHFAVLGLNGMKEYANTVTPVDAFYKEDMPFTGNSL